MTNELKPIAISQFDWISPKTAAIQVTECINEDTEEGMYSVHLLLWSDINEHEDFPLIIETSICSDDLDDVLTSAIDLCESLAGYVCARVDMYDSDGDQIGALDLNEYFEDESCHGCDKQDTCTDRQD